MSKSTAVRRPRTSALWGRAMELAAQPHGMCAADLHSGGQMSGNAADVLKTLVAEGRLTRVALNRKLVRYFANPEDAQRLLALANAPLPSVRAAAAARHRAPWPADAPMVITPQTKFTRVPTPAPALRTNTHSQL